MKDGGGAGDTSSIRGGIHDPWTQGCWAKGDVGYVPIYLRSKFTGATHILMAVFSGTFTIKWP